MADLMNTARQDAKYGGPVISTDYNLRIEQNYQDLLYLYNKANTLDEESRIALERVLKDQAMLSNAVVDLSNRISALESDQAKLSIYSFSQIDYARFNGTSFSIGPTELLSLDPTYNSITLPRIASASSSKIKFYNPVDGQIVSDLFKVRIDNSFGGVDSPGAIVSSTPVYQAILDNPNKVWSRTIISNSNASGPAELMLYCKLSSEFTGSLRTNCVRLNPYPMHSVNVYSVEYTNSPNPSLTNNDVWTPLNFDSLYDNEHEAIGYVPPGGYSTLGFDEIRNAGPLSFYFAEIEMTAVRVRLRQSNYFKEMDKYSYTYGLSDFDIRYDKFASTGKIIVNYKAPTGRLFAGINSVDPIIYNVSRSNMSKAFSYRVIYQNGDSYSTSNPGASSEVWIEVTLNALEDKTAPVLSDLVLDYDYV